MAQKVVRQKSFKIKPLFWDQGDPEITKSQVDSIQAGLAILMPEVFSEKSAQEEEISRLKGKFLENLPVVSLKSSESIPGNLSFYLLARYRANAFKFFFDMISYWLIPGHRLNVILFYAADFTLPEFGEDIYTFCDVTVRVSSPEELLGIESNFPMIQKEIELGVASLNHARRILEIKGLAADVKTALIHENIAILIKRRPSDFDYDVFAEMQHVLMICPESFKHARSSRHLCRIISLQYLFRRALFEAIEIAPKKRHISMKLFRSTIREGEKERKVVGILIGINLLSNKEVFEERHLIKAIQNYLPDAVAIEGSFIINRRGSEKLFTLYLEVEKGGGGEFSNYEFSSLRKELPNSVKDRIEHLMHPVFMPRNEEEVMRNILSLANQITRLGHPPQVFISFDEQTSNKLYFTVIFVRALRKSSRAIADVFQESDTFLDYKHDSVKVVGHLRKKYPKEATVFRVSLQKEMFLRGDHSIDLYKARQVVSQELERVLHTKFRDYNGGMISKQSELFCHLRTLVAEGGTYNELLLENFFYSINPSIMRNVLDPEDLKRLYGMMVKAVDKKLAVKRSFIMSIDRELDRLFLVVVGDNPQMRGLCQKELCRLNIPATNLGTIFVHSNGFPCLGFIYSEDDPYNQDLFCQKVEVCIEEAHTFEPS